MILDQHLVDIIFNAVKTAHSLSIENIIIDEESIRGLDENKTVFLLHQGSLELPFKSICITRSSFFLSRMDIAKTQKDFTVEATVDSDSDFVRSLTFKAKKTKIEYRCGNPLSFEKVPRQLRSTPVCSGKMTPDAVAVLQKGQNAMSAEKIAITGDKEDQTLTFEMQDVGGDIFSYTLTDKIQPINNEEIQFSYAYPSKVLVSLFKMSPDSEFEIGVLGTVKVTVNGLSAYIIPQKR